VRGGEGAHIWLEYAQLQTEISPEDGRDVFKHMKRMHIAVDDAALYVSWADLEAREGNEEKAMSILQRAQERSAVDQGPIDAATAKLNGGAPVTPIAVAGADETITIGRRPAEARTMSASEDKVALCRSTRHASSINETIAIVRTPQQSVQLSDTAVFKPPSLDVAPAVTARAPAAKPAPAAPAATAAREPADRTIVFPSREKCDAASKSRVGFAPKSLGLGTLGRLGPARRATDSEQEEEMATALAAQEAAVASAGATLRAAAEVKAPVGVRSLPAMEDATLMRPELQLHQHGLCAIVEDEERTSYSIHSARSSRSSTSDHSSNDGTVRINADRKSRKSSLLSLPATPTMAMRTPAVTRSALPTTPARTAIQPPVACPATDRKVGQAPLSATKPLPPAHMPAATAQTPPAPAVDESTSTAASVAAAAINAAPASARAFRGGAEVHVNGVAYMVLEMLGKGGTSQVFRVLSPESEILALKQVRLDTEADGDGQLLQAVQNEIELMQSFKSKGLTKYIINLVDAEVKLREQIVYMVMECGEIDLAGMLRRHRQEALDQCKDGDAANDNFVCMYWEQMLRAVHAIHEARVIHGDLKPANFLCVRGALKLIDFGIAKTMTNPDNTKIARENTMGTVNYMSPEAIYGDEESGHRQGRASDVWSLGCILYQMIHGATPFSHLKNIIQKMQAITNESVAINFPPLRNQHMQEVIQACLHRRADLRPPIPTLLNHALLRTPPPPSPVAPGAVGLSVEQLGELLQQVAHAGEALSTEALLQQIQQRQQSCSCQPLDVRTLVSASLRPPTPTQHHLAPSAGAAAVTARTPLPANSAAAPSPFAASRRRDMPGSVTRTRLPAPPPTSLPVAPPQLAAAPAPLTRTSSQICAADLQQVKLKRIQSGTPRTTGTASVAGGRQNEWADDFLRRSMASRRQGMAAGEDDTVDVTDAFGSQ
jgi:serine/threonine-protein kinase TTK/MPS1